MNSKNKNKKILILIIFTTIFQYANGQSFVGYSNDFLNIGVGAKNIAQGGSTIADIDDFSSGYYNPAGLSELKNKYEFGLLHSEYFAGIVKYDFAGFSYKLDSTTGISASLIRLGVDNIQNTLFLYDDNGNIDYSRIEFFSVSDYALLVSLGRKSIISGLSYGLTAKIIYRSQGEFAKAYGFGIDIGAQYSISGWNFGAKLNNATTSFTAWFFNLSDQAKDVFLETGNELPKNTLEISLPILNLGVSKNWDFDNKIGLRTEINLNLTFDGKRNALISFNPISVYPQAGIEINYARTLYIRSGINNFQLIPNFSSTSDSTNNYFQSKNLDFVPNIGIGIVFKKIYIDYALTDVGNQSVSLYSHIFSISFKF